MLAPAAAADRGAIQELLDRRAAAIVEGDRRAFLATIAGDPNEFRSEQAGLFRRLQGLPLASYRLRARWDRLGELARESDRRLYPDAADVVIPVTEERYRLAGFDRSAAVEDIFFTFVKHDDEWRIASDTDMDDVTLFSARHPWDFRTLSGRERGHFLLLEPRCEQCSTAPPSALALAEQAHERVVRYWSPPWHKRVPLVIPNSARDLKRMLQLTFDVGNFVAFAVSTVDLREGVDYTGHRIVLNPDAFVGRTSDSTLDILAHEILHVATREVSGPFVPSWVEEGLAEYVGNEGSTSALAFLIGEASVAEFDGRLPAGYQFTIGSGVDIFRSYQESYSAVRYFIERWGLNRFIRFYRTLGRPEVAPGLASYHVDRALRQTVGMGLARFQRAWAGTIDTP